MVMYAKVYTSMYSGTLRGRAHEILVFTNLLAFCDREGYVDKHPRAIADEVGLTVDQVKVALNNLESPDPESRSEAEDGRRIVRIDDHRTWGWQVVNYVKYRAMRDEDERRAQNRAAQARRRSRQDSSASASVSIRQPSQPESAHAEAEAEAEADTQADAPAARGSSENAAHSPLADPPSAARRKKRPPASTSDQPKAQRPRDEIWDAVAKVFYGGKVPTSLAAMVGKRVRDLKDLGATPVEIETRRDRIVAMWGTGGATIHSLVKNWGIVAKPPMPKKRDDELRFESEWELESAAAEARYAKECEELDARIAAERERQTADAG